MERLERFHPSVFLLWRVGPDEERPAVRREVDHEAVLDILSVREDALADVPRDRLALAALTDARGVVVPRQLVVPQHEVPALPRVEHRPRHLALQPPLLRHARPLSNAGPASRRRRRSSLPLHPRPAFHAAQALVLARPDTAAPEHRVPMPLPSPISPIVAIASTFFLLGPIFFRPQNSH